MSVWQERALCQMSHGALHYRCGGDVSMPVLVLLHQAPSDARMFEALVPYLQAHFRLFAPDIPGFGFSDPLPPGYSLVDLAAALEHWMTDIGLDTVSIFGHHTGAALAIALAAHWPARVRALSLCGPTLLTDAQRDLLQTAGDLPATAADGQHLLQLWARLRAKDPQAPLAISQRESESAMRAGPHWGNTYRAIAANPTAQQLAAIDCPVQVMAGDADLLYPNVMPTLALLRRGQRATLPAGAGSYVCERWPAELAQVIQPFLRPE